MPKAQSVSAHHGHHAPTFPQHALCPRLVAPSTHFACKNCSCVLALLARFLRTEAVGCLAPRGFCRCLCGCWCGSNWNPSRWFAGCPCCAPLRVCALGSPRCACSRLPPLRRTSSEGPCRCCCAAAALAGTNARALGSSFLQHEARSVGLQCTAHGFRRNKSRNAKRSKAEHDAPACRAGAHRCRPQTRGKREDAVLGGGFSEASFGREQRARSKANTRRASKQIVETKEKQQTLNC